jgi:hypothetical protein
MAFIYKNRTNDLFYFNEFLANSVGVKTTTLFSPVYAQ